MAQQKNLAAVLTMTLSGVAGVRGRPLSGKAKTNAQRQKEWRKRHKSVETGETIAATIKRLSEQFELSESYITRELLRFALCNKNWAQTGFPLCVTEKKIEAA